MTHSAVKEHLLAQLLYFEEQRSLFLDHYFPPHSTPARLRQSCGELIDRYIRTLDGIVRCLNDDGAVLERVVLIGSKVSLHFLDDGCLETYTIRFPEQADPDTGAISFLSPVGQRVLMAERNETLHLTVPTGKSVVRIADVVWGDDPVAGGAVIELGP